MTNKLHHYDPRSNSTEGIVFIGKTMFCREWIDRSCQRAMEVMIIYWGWFVNLIGSIFTIGQRAKVLTHPYKYILTSPVTYSQQLSVLYWMNNSMISKYLLSTLSFLFKNNSLTEVVYLLIRWESGLVG